MTSLDNCYVSNTNQGISQIENSCTLQQDVSSTSASLGCKSRELIFQGNNLSRFMIQALLPKLNFELESAPENVKDIISSYLKEYQISNEYFSFMKTRFHPVVTPSFLPPLNRDIEWITKKGSLSDFPLEKTPSAITKWMNEVKIKLGIIKVNGYILTSNKTEELKRGLKPSSNRIYTKRKTCRANFDLLPHKQLVRNGTPFSHYPDRLRAIKLISKLDGRIHVWKDAWLTANSLPIAKTGLVSILVDKFVEELSGSWDNFVLKFPATYALLTICCSVFSERKSFTLDSQKQGALNKYMVNLLSIVQDTEKDGMKIVALFLPTWDIFSSISVEDAKVIYETSMVWLNHMASFLQEQWDKGYNKCVRRLCRVPPRGSKVNSSGLNAVADAWMNLRRFQTVSAKRASIKGAPLILKVMQLIADDQFQWGGGSVNPNTNVFKTITSSGILPWNALLQPESFDTRQALTVVLDAIGELEPEQAKKSSVDSWVGIAKLRTSEVSKPVDMICGCAVPSMSEECANFIKEIGIFGASPWKGL